MEQGLHLVLVENVESGPFVDPFLTMGNIKVMAMVPNSKEIFKLGGNRGISNPTEMIVLSHLLFAQVVVVQSTNIL